MRTFKILFCTFIVTALLSNVVTPTPSPTSESSTVGQQVVDPNSTDARTFISHAIENGLEIHCSVAIDYGNSNGKRNEKTSLHYTDPNEPSNKYEQAIIAMVGALEDYVAEKHFLVYGFGAKYQSDVIRHDFKIDLKDNSKIIGVQGVLAAYKEGLFQATMSSPTNLAPTIRKAVERAKYFPSQRNNYLILLVLTDGQIDDILEIEKAIDAATQQPISIVIVGIGDKDFSNMERLDCDSEPGKECTFKPRRDIVQFVALSKHAIENPDACKMFVNEALAEVPAQMLQYENSRN